MRLVGPTVILCGLIAACSSSSGTPKQSDASTCAPVAALDPGGTPYGKTYGQWAASWEEWYVSETVCADDPIKDTTGQFCATNQKDPDVFFLTGDFGGTVTRTECKVPQGKALFMPILETEDDNAGVAAPQPASAIEKQANAFLTSVEVSSLVFEVDCAAVTDFAPFLVKATEFSYTLGPDPNFYTCFGENGITGQVTPAYVAGYWVMLQPLPPGPHSIHFSGKTTGNATFSLDVTYKFTIE